MKLIEGLLSREGTGVLGTKTGSHLIVDRKGIRSFIINILC